MSETTQTVAPPEGEESIDPLAEFRLTMREAKVLFRRSRSGVPGLARVLAESLEEVLARYDAVARERDRLRVLVEEARAILTGDAGDEAPAP